LRDDDEARAFGVAMIWDMRDAAALYQGCTMHIADGKRAGFDIPFERPLVAPRRYTGAPLSNPGSDMTN